MNICFLAAANSIHSYKWISFFAERGHEVHWISLAPSIFDHTDNIHYYEIAQSSVTALSILNATMKVRKLLVQISPEILHVHSAGTYGLVGALSGFHPLIITAWGSDVIYGARSMLKRPLVRFSLNQADLITCDAEHMKESMVKLGVAPARINIVYFGVDTRKFSPGGSSREARDELGICGAPAVVSLRSFEPVYDIETLIAAVPDVLERVPETKFVIVGRGTLEAKLKKQAEQLGVFENIRFVGYIPNDDLPKYLSSMDVYVSTSLSDAGIASSTAEAMACGLPVVITDSGENRNWVIDGENGFIVPISTPKVLADKIVFLLNNADLRSKFGKSGREIIEKRNNYYKEMIKMEGFYERMITNGD